MSYLGFPRLHFSGCFQTNPSTVNNDPAHFNVNTFTPNDQLPATSKALNGWGDPNGGNYWRLRNCTVKSVYYRDGSFCTDAKQDAVIGMALCDADTRVGGKLVDLDPEQQNVSEIWGVQVRLVDQQQRNVFTSAFVVAPFADIWFRNRHDQSAVYQSVLGNIEWPAATDSRFLQELAINGQYPTQLSIKFALDGYNANPSSPDFTFGRVVGALGLYQPGEPTQFVAGRLLRSLPQEPLNYAPCRIDAEKRLLLVDFANSMPTTAPGGPLQDLGSLYMAICLPDQQYTLLGRINYQTVGWYEHWAGIQAFPLNAQQLALATHTPLAVVQLVTEPPTAAAESLVEQAHIAAVLLRENEEGAFARAEPYVLRLDAHSSATVDLYATKFGEPWADQTFALNFDNSSVAGFIKQSPDLLPGPPVGIPASALQFPSQVQTDQNGKAQITLQAQPPGNPRGYIDGQIYGVRYDWQGISPLQFNNPAPKLNPAYILNVLVWDDYQCEGDPTWVDDVQPIFQQYANLYPVMRGIVNLADYNSVIQRLSALKLVFSRPVTDPNYMPVTRDLSTPKRAMIRRWLENPLFMNLNSVERLRRALQLAIELEHATIPVYLCALYSLKPGHNRVVGEIIRSVVVEEMLHMALACNLLNAIGGSPQIDQPHFIPRYPGPLPGGLRPDLTVSLKKCSLEQIHDVFMSIEKPEETIHTPNPHTLTIGWFYQQIAAAFKNLSAQGNLFTGDPTRQLHTWPEPGKLIPVADLRAALRAIHEIVDQGEGTARFKPENRAGELAHYYRFAEIVQGHKLVITDKGFSFTGTAIHFDPDGVWPMIDNPDTQALPADSQARVLSAGFNQSYANLLRVLHAVVNGQPEQLDAVIGMMFALSLQAQQLMQTPIAPDNPATAGPSFQYPTAVT